MLMRWALYKRAITIGNAMDMVPKVRLKKNTISHISLRCIHVFMLN